MALIFRGGILLSGLPHRIRVWRRVEQRTDTGNLKTPTYRDAYGSDIPCRVRPETVLLESGVARMPPATPMVCDVPARDSLGSLIRVQVAPPDVFEIKRTRVRRGKRAVVETTLEDPAAAGTTALRVVDAWGFEPEEVIVLETAAQDDWYVGFVESISGNTINLRSTRDIPEGKSFSAGDTVKIAHTAQVTGRRNPLQVDHLHVVSIRQSAPGAWALE